MSDVVAGVAWAADAAYTKAQKKDSKHKGSVANMSLGGGASFLAEQRELELIDRKSVV